MDSPPASRTSSFQSPSYQSRFQREIDQAVRERARLLGQQASRERIARQPFASR